MEHEEWICVPLDVEKRQERAAAQKARRGRQTAPFDVAPTLTEAAHQMVRSWVLYKDERCIILNKPSGIPTQGGSKVQQSVVDLLPGLQFDKYEPPRLTHRLDRDASGILILGRTRATTSELMRHFSDNAHKKSAARLHKPNKVYWAVVGGSPEFQRGKVELPLGKVADRSGREKIRVTEGSGVHAATNYAMKHKGTVDGAPVAWLSLYPVTGRKHQLRVHCATGLGCPIIGDGKYALPQLLPDGSHQRLHLHHRKVVLPWKTPGKKELTTVTAPLPPHMLETWRACGWNPDAEEATVNGDSAEPVMRL
jgi:23S rRNA pseudouridine955/2504/2580 synthase